MPKLELICILALIVSVLGCSRSKPPRYYTLASSPPSTAVGAAPAKALSIGIASVRLPAYLDNPQMIVRLDEHEIRMDDQHRWGEDVKRGFERVLAEELSARMPTVDVHIQPWPASLAPTCELDISVSSFEVDSGSNARLRAEWELQDTRARRVLREEPVSITEPVQAPDWGSRSEALSRAIAGLARDISEGLGHSQDGCTSR